MYKKSRIENKQVAFDLPDNKLINNVHIVKGFKVEIKVNFSSHPANIE